MFSDNCHDTAEVTTGTAVVVLALAIGALVYQHSGAVSGYDLDVHLAKSDGLSRGSDVRVSGVSVGEVSSVVLDPSTYLATVHMNIRDGIELPVDSFAEVKSDGPLGNLHMLIHPGKSKTMLPAGGVITKSCGSEDVMSMIGRVGLTNGQSLCPFEANN